MSVILQFSDVRKQSISAQSQDGAAVPSGGAEILIFPGVRIERKSLQSERPAGASSAGGTDE